MRVERARDRALVALVAAGAAAVVAVAASGAAGTVSPRAQSDDFPHAAHAGLFPVCEACHAGIPEGRAEAFYSVAPSDCASCHDGVRLERVEWRAPPAPRISNLDFSHPEHAQTSREAGETALDCGACHRIPRAARRMDVQAAAAEACLSCHAHQATAHLAAGVACAECHLALGEAEALSIGRIAAFPAPADHEDGDFIWRHGGVAETEPARCAVCHAQESCTRCHLNADRLPAVAELPEDDRVAALVAGEPGHWPVPPSHRRPDWLRAHGAAARADVQVCANCHAAPSCEVCHGEARLPVVARLPRPGPEQPSGVQVGPTRPPGHTADFFQNHGAAAAVDLPACASCHTDRECASCHLMAAADQRSHPGARLPDGFSPRDGMNAMRLASVYSEPPPSGPGVRSTADAGWTWPTGFPSPDLGSPPADTVPTDTLGADRGGRGSPPAPSPSRRLASPEEGGFGGGGFHPPNFVLRHGAEAFAAPTECAECHAREAFCRSCHASLGIAAERGFLTGGFHDGQPEWLLSHGRAARQSMELCASCHQQTSCLRCHSARAGWGVNPHGPGFDPARVGNRSRMSCGICHFTDPLDRP